MKSHYSQAELVKMQVEREIKMKTAGVERFDRNNDRVVKSGVASETAWNKRIIQELIEPMAEAIDVYIDYYKGRRGKPSKTLTFLGLLPSNQSAYITIKCILNSLTRETEVLNVAKTVGSRIEDQVRFAGLASSAPKYIEKVMDQIKQRQTSSYQHARRTLTTSERNIVKGNKDKEIEGLPELAWDSWNEQEVCQLGSQLIDIFANNVLFEGETVINKRNYVDGKSNKSFLEPTEHIQGWINQFKEAMSLMEPAFAPCIIPPRDWTTPTRGGYHIQQVAETLPLVSCRKRQRNRLTIEQMPEVYKAINSLQSVAWQVNDKVLDVFRQVIQLGLPYGVPSSEPLDFPEVPIDPELQDLRGEDLKAMLNNDEWREFSAWKREMAETYSSEQKRKADVLKVARLLSSASQYREFERIYFVYTMDFRGRIYARTDSVSPQGDDLQKGLINFAEGKALGSRGMHWLAVHGANVYGEDKVTFDDRFSFIQGMSEEIRDIAADPLTFTDWTKADKPYQFLNWCFEWSSLMDWLEDGNKAEDFISRTPVALDGSCSGIQHYSAILRDPVGGKAVNLVPDSKPNDIYSEVSDKCNAKFLSLSCETDEMDKDGNPKRLPEIAQGWLDIKGGFNRGITKSPSMTLTYGSTHVRCIQTTDDYLHKLQVEEDAQAKINGTEPVKVHPFADRKGEPGVPRYHAVRLGADVIWESIGEVVVAAKTGMKYIQDVASVVSKAGKHLEIVAPTGFICEVREMDYTSRRVKTQLLGKTYMTLKEEKTTFNTRKMRTSSAPHFIHLHDAAHLVKAVNSSFYAGLESVAVIHDSFASHACNVDTLNHCLVNTLADMYLEHDVLQDLKDHNEMIHAMEIEVDKPEELGLDLNLIRQSEYCFG